MKQKANSYRRNNISLIATVLLVTTFAVVNTVVYAQDYTSYGNWSYAEEYIKDAIGIKLSWVWSNWTFATLADGKFNLDPSVTYFRYGAGGLWFLGAGAEVDGVYVNPQPNGLTSMLVTKLWAIGMTVNENFQNNVIYLGNGLYLIQISAQGDRNCAFSTTVTLPTHFQYNIGGSC